jgi:hypothetical protein
MYAFRPYLVVQGFALARDENCYCVMYAVQLLDVLSVPRMHWRRPRAPSAAAPLDQSSRYSRSAVLPLDNTSNFPAASHAPRLPAHHFERFLRDMTTIQAQGALKDEHTAPSRQQGTASRSPAPAGSQLGAGYRNEDQFKLSRWPWSMLGKEVCLQNIPSDSWWHVSCDFKCPFNSKLTNASQHQGNS